MSFKNSAENVVSRHVGYTPEAFEKLHGRKPTDWENEKEEGEVITFDKNTDWSNVQVDVANQQIIIKDPKKNEFRVVDLKKSGLSILSSSQWVEIEKNSR